MGDRQYEGGESFGYSLEMHAVMQTGRGGGGNRPETINWNPHNYVKIKHESVYKVKMMSTKLDSLFICSFCPI